MGGVINLQGPREGPHRHPGPTEPNPSRTPATYVSHSSTVRHNPHRARTRPRTGTRIRW
jgi:hypothetical protein